jgi:hypothetical protein
VRAGELRRVADLLGEASGRANPMLAPTVSENEKVLEDNADRVAEVLDTELAHVRSVHEHAPELRS